MVKGTSANTGLPAPFAVLTPPNPWSVTPFARVGKRRAGPAGSATRGRYTTWDKNKQQFVAASPEATEECCELPLGLSPIAPFRLFG